LSRHRQSKLPPKRNQAEQWASARRLAKFMGNLFAAGRRLHQVAISAIISGCTVSGGVGHLECITASFPLTAIWG
jgi:hypothetical protein